MNRFQRNISINKQRGAAFILFFVLLVIGFSFFILQRSNNNDRKNEEQTRRALLDAKEALIAFAVADIRNNRMGRLPWPDRRNDVNYDGSGDFTNAILNNNNLMLGRFPWRNDPMDDPFPPLDTREIGADLRDGSSERLWYAVSRNLVRHNGNFQPAFDPVALTTAANWLTIIIQDNAGNTIQTIPNIAFVIIAPGSPINGQIRSGVAPLPNRYLDSSFGINNFDVAGPVFDFVIAPKSSTFNDVLIYVTRDELIAAVYQRVFNEVRTALNTYYTANNFFPYAGDITGECQSASLDDRLAITDVLPATPAPDCGGADGVIAALPAYINNAMANDITYTVLNNCVQSPPATANCNTIPGVVQLSSDAFPNLRAQLP